MIGVLIVEDDFRVARLHAEIAGQVAGLQVLGQVHTASAALEAIGRRRPDLLLLDLFLPDASGLALLARIRSLAEPPDVIILSAANDMASVRTAMRRGALGYLVKPFDLETLRERLRQYVQLHARRSTEGQIGQEQIDELFGALRGEEAAPAVRLPKGHSAATAKLVLGALADAGRPLSAVELAEQVGISRATAQRYLASLAEAGSVKLALRYGSTGRPEHRYELLRQ